MGEGPAGKKYKKNNEIADDKNSMWRLTHSSDPQGVYSSGSDAMSTASTVRQRTADDGTKQDHDQERGGGLLGIERASRSGSESTVATEIPIEGKYEDESGLRWNRIAPGKTLAIV